ncbi:MAG: hypothetical protein LKG27_01170 [Clostridiaceae bacterium]|jgi:hypothetical protein|nr:hypothetical protein [Clostridiaceae bacterium]
MNIKITNGYNNLYMGSSSKFKHPLSSTDNISTGVCGQEQENNARFSGSFTGKSEAAANTLKRSLSQRFLESKHFSKFLEYVHAHNIATSALIALGFAGVMRPATILSLPGKKDKDDKIYASGHSIASALMGFGVSLILTSPLDVAIKKIENNTICPKKLKQLNETIENLENSTQSDEVIKKLKSLKAHRKALMTLGKNVPDWFIAIPRAALTIALIPPILKYVFGIEKNKKPEAKKQTNTQNEISSIPQPDNFILKSAAFKNVQEGGQK